MVGWHHQPNGHEFEQAPENGLGRKVMTNLDSTLKSRDITLPTKVRLIKGMVFPVVMYGCESQAIKKAECGDLNGKKIQKRGDMCICIADSVCCTAETNTNCKPTIYCNKN